MKKTAAFIVFFLALALSPIEMQAQSSLTSQVGCPVYIPNAFTPNGDDLNDRFVIKLSEECEVMEYSLRIFDRWGRLVYESHDYRPSSAWDGTFKGRELQAGVYMYDFSIKLRNHKNESTESSSKKGSLVLVR